jgi:ribosomal protein L7/L12
MTKKFELLILKALDDLYEKTRKKVMPRYPVNKKTGKIELPDDVIADLKFFLLVGNKPATVKRVCELTGVGLRVSKDFVDSLQ